jgi:hypothetical protein
MNYAYLALSQPRPNISTPLRTQLTELLMNRLHATVVTASLLLFAPITPVAMAQFGGRAGFSEALKPDLLPRDMTMIVETLKLEEWQRPIVQSLLEDYQISFKTGTDALQQKMQDNARKQKGAMNDVRLLLAPIEAWAPEKERLYEDLMASIKSQLSENQQERWPKFERAVRRSKSLDDSDLAGEGVDLIFVIRQMQLPPDVVAVAEPLLDQYEISLDVALKARDAKITSLMPQFTEAMTTMDINTGGNLQDQIIATRIQVRQVQDDSIETIAAQLPAPHGQDFRSRALAQGYREAFQPDALGSFFAAVLNLNDLTSEQRSQVQAIQVTWENAFMALQTRMLETIRAEEPKKAQRKILALAAKRVEKSGGVAPEVPPDLMVPLRNEKNKLVQETRESVLKLLAEDQIDRLSAGTPGLRPPPPPSISKGQAPGATNKAGDTQDTNSNAPKDSKAVE